MKKNVIRLECGIRFQFAAPIAILVLGGEKEFAGGIDRCGHAASEAVDFAEA